MYRKVPRVVDNRLERVEQMGWTSKSRKADEPDDNKQKYSNAHVPCPVCGQMARPLPGGGISSHKVKEEGSSKYYTCYG